MWMTAVILVFTVSCLVGSALCISWALRAPLGVRQNDAVSMPERKPLARRLIRSRLVEVNAPHLRERG